MNVMANTRRLLIRHRVLLHFLGFVLGLLTSAFVVFQIFFLAKVLPHGGL